MAGILAPWDWVILAVIIGVLFLGHKRLPGLGRALGQGVNAFRKAWKEGPKGPSRARESAARGYVPSPGRSAKHTRSAPPAGLLRVLVRSPRGRKLVFWGLVVLGVAYGAITLADGLLGGRSSRAKAIAALGFFVLGLGLLAASWLAHRPKGTVSSRVDR